VVVEMAAETIAPPEMAAQAAQALLLFGTWCKGE
jgi:hypothetical protein